MEVGLNDWTEMTSKISSQVHNSKSTVLKPKAWKALCARRVVWTHLGSPGQSENIQEVTENQGYKGDPLLSNFLSPKTLPEYPKLQSNLLNS